MAGGAGEWILPSEWWNRVGYAANSYNKCDDGNCDCNARFVATAIVATHDSPPWSWNNMCLSDEATESSKIMSSTTRFEGSSTAYELNSGKRIDRGMIWKRNGMSEPQSTFEQRSNSLTWWAPCALPLTKICPLSTIYTGITLMSIGILHFLLEPRTNWPWAHF